MVASQFMLRSSREISSLMPSCNVRSSDALVTDLGFGRHLPAHLAVAEIEDAHQGRGAVLLTGCGDGVQSRGLAEGAQKFPVRTLARCAA